MGDVVEPVQVQSAFLLLEKKMKKKYAEPTAEERTRNPNVTPSSPFYFLLQSFRRCNKLRNKLRDALEAQTIEVSRTKNSYESVVNTFAEAVESAVAGEKASSVQDLVDLKEECDSLKPQIQEAIEKEENLRTQCEQYREEIVRAQEESNSMSTLLNEGIVFRTSLLVEINNTKIERNKVIEETKKIERNTKDLKEEIEKDKEEAKAHEEEMLNLERSTMMEYVQLKQKHHNRDNALQTLLKELEKSRKELLEENSALRQRVKPLELALAEAITTGKAIRGGISSFEEGIQESREKLRMERKAMKEREREHEICMRRTHESIQHCKAQARVSEKEAEEKSGNTISLTKECKVLEREKDKHERVLEGLVSRAREAREEMEWKSAEVHELTIKINTLEDDLKTKRTESSITVMGEKAKLSKLETEYNHTKSERVRMEGELKEDQNTLDLEKKQYLDKKHELESTTRSEDARSSQLSESIAQHKQRITACTAEIEKLMIAIPKLKEEKAARHDAFMQRHEELTRNIATQKEKARGLDEEDKATQKLLADLEEDLKVKHEQYLKLCNEKDHQQSLLSTRLQALEVVSTEKERVLVPNAKARGELNESLKLLRHKQDMYSSEINTLDYRLGLIKRRQNEFTQHQTRVEEAVEHLQQDNDYVRRSTIESEETTRQLIEAIKTQPRTYPQEVIGDLPVTMETNKALTNLQQTLCNCISKLEQVGVIIEETAAHSSVQYLTETQ
eukprot:m.36199 g.36199  ORF g.36199 m.36199 type:complete len:736 (+) comp10080_c0_seq3:107-2314(+)